MNDQRKRALTFGVIIGAAIAFLLVLTKRTPPEKRRETYLRASRDGLRLAKLRYGVVAAPLFSLADHLLERFDVADNSPSVK